MGIFYIKKVVDRGGTTQKKTKIRKARIVNI